MRSRGCTAVMESSVHANNRFGGGFLEDPYFHHHHQDVQKLQYLDQQMMFFAAPTPPSAGTVQNTSGNKETGNNFVKRELVAPQQHQVLEGRGDGVDGYHGRRELGCAVFGESRNRSWNGNDLVTEYEALLPTPSSSPAMTSPSISQSPDNKRITPEPRSVLDLAMSPRPTTRSSVLPSFDFVSTPLGPDSVLLDTQDEFLSDFHRRDSSAAHLLSLADENSSQWGTPSNSSDCLQQTSHLWMDSLIDDLGAAATPAQSSLPGLETEGDDAHTDDTPSSTPSQCQLSPSTDQENSEGEETTTTTGDGTATATAAEDSPRTLQQVQSVSSREKQRESSHLEVGLKLVNLLLACAESVSTKSLGHVNTLFAQLGELASPEGTSMQRVAAYFTEGLATRCSRLWPHIYQPLPYNLDLSEEDSHSAYLTLNCLFPYTKFAHFTANEIILQAFEGCDHVHVIDFDIKQGLQWPALFQSLAARPGGPPAHVRVTGIGDCKDDVQDTGDRLAEFAEGLGLPFQFHAVIDKLEDVRLWMLHVKEKEVVAVNCILQLHRTLYDSENGIKDMLGLITSTKAKVVAMVEQEASHNGAFFEGRTPRFLESLQYYAAIFDSLDFNMPLESKTRMKVEQFFAREIRNILACEGPERVERHERMETWRRHMDMGGFKSVPLKERARTQARLLLEMYACKSYTITEDEGALTLGWRDRSLFTASAWAPKQ